MSSGPYVASEDSALLRSVLRGNSGRSCLEIGAGNAGNLVELSAGFDIAVGTDVVKPRMRDWRETGASYVLSDRASCFRSGSFDLVVFNPPYLPTDEVADVAVDGGRGEIPLQFLKEALRAVKDSGRVLMLLNGETSLSAFEAECNRKGFALRKVAAKRLFYEELSVYEATAGSQSLHQSRKGRTTGA